MLRLKKLDTLLVVLFNLSVVSPIIRISLRLCFEISNEYLWVDNSIISNIFSHDICLLYLIYFILIQFKLKSIEIHPNVVILSSFQLQHHWLYLPLYAYPASLLFVLVKILICRFLFFLHIPTRSILGIYAATQESVQSTNLWDVTEERRYHVTFISNLKRKKCKSKENALILQWACHSFVVKQSPKFTFSLIIKKILKEF